MNGVFYVATGDEWVREAVISARSLKEHMPGIHATLYSDGDVQEERAFDIVERIQLPPGDQRIETLHRRIEIMAEVPYERALRLDTDTFIMGDLSPVFELLDRFDLVSAHASTRLTLPLDDVPATFPEYHAGLVAFNRSEKITRFVKAWASKFREQVAFWTERQEKLPPKICPYHADQAAMRWALYHSDLRLATLMPEWDCCAYCGFAQGEIKLIHARGARLERAKRSLNEHLGSRVYIEGEIVGRP